MATLTVAHHINLTRQQRYDLHNGQEIDVIGVAIPVWFYKGNTSEPAQEIFCKYKIKNQKNGVNITRVEEGFEINMPHVDIHDYGDLNPDFVKQMQIKIGTTDCLLDLEENGKEEVYFKFYQKLEIEKKLHHLIHFVEIKTIEQLIDSTN